MALQSVNISHEGMSRSRFPEICASGYRKSTAERPRRRRGSSIPVILGPIGLLLVECFGIRSAAAELGPCKSAAPTTKDVVVFVTDMKRSIEWYHDNVGLVETTMLRSIERDARAVVMEKDDNGVTLMSSGKQKLLGPDPQMVCFPQKGFHIPGRGPLPVFLVDPDGTQVELADAP